ncbi:MAG: N-acetylmuramic acid 6-phosphate etherase [Phycisphaeraceae bacterium]
MTSPHSGSSQPRSTADRGGLSTEKRLDTSAALDALTIEQTLQVMNEQDAMVPAVVRAALPAITALARAAAHALERGGRLIYVGAGTSGRLGVLDAAECPPTFHSDPEQVVGLIAGGDRALRQAVEGAEDDESAMRSQLQRLHVNENDIVVGIAAGGTTACVWGALAEAAQHGAATGLVTCIPLDQLQASVAVDYPVALPVGAEVVTGSTRLKAGTATKLTLNMITTAAFVQRGKVWGNLMVDLRVTNAKLRDRALRIICEQTDLSRDAAAEVLDRASGHVKVALVMARLGIMAEEAERRLAETDGHLRPILGPPR